MKLGKILGVLVSRGIVVLVQSALRFRGSRRIASTPLWCALRLSQNGWTRHYRDRRLGRWLRSHSDVRPCFGTSGV